MFNSQCCSSNGNSRRSIGQLARTVTLKQTPYHTIMKNVKLGTPSIMKGISCHANGDVSQMLKMCDSLELGMIIDAVITDAKRGGMQSLKTEVFSDNPHRSHDKKSFAALVPKLGYHENFDRVLKYEIVRSKIVFYHFI